LSQLKKPVDVAFAGSIYFAPTSQISVYRVVYRGDRFANRVRHAPAVGNIPHLTVSRTYLALIRSITIISRRCRS
jgi:hypothetical protein